MPKAPCDECGTTAHLVTIEPRLGPDQDLCRECRFEHVTDLLEEAESHG